MQASETPNVRKNSTNFFKLTACCRMQETGVPDVRHSQWLVDSAAALIEKLFGLIYIVHGQLLLDNFCTLKLQKIKSDFSEKLLYKEDLYS